MMLGENLEGIWAVFQSELTFNNQTCCLTLKTGPTSLDFHRDICVILVADGSGRGEMVRTYQISLYLHDLKPGAQQ